MEDPDEVGKASASGEKSGSKPRSIIARWAMLCKIASVLFFTRPDRIHGMVLFTPPAINSL
jgi:hypothetical protein